MQFSVRHKNEEEHATIDGTKLIQVSSTHLETARPEPEPDDDDVAEVVDGRMVGATAGASRRH